MTEKQVWVDQTTSAFRPRWTQPAIVIHGQVGMEQTALTPTASRRFGRISPIKRQSLQLLLALFTLMSIASFAATALGRIRVVARELSDNPFLAYREVLPGQRTDAALLDGFSCTGTMLPSPADSSEQCAYYPETGPFSQVNITVWDGIIIRLRFAVRDNTLRVGDLAMLWGAPDIQSYAQGASLYRWREHSIVALTSSNGGRFTYFLPVSYLHFDAVGRWSKSG